MVSVIILAAGSSARMNGVNKQLAKIGGIPVFVMSALAFENCQNVGEIIIAAPIDDCRQFEEIARSFGVSKLSCVVGGGSSRFMSMKNALERVDPKADFIAFHDGARPLITAEDIGRVFADAEKYNAAIAAVPAVDTVKSVSDGGFIEDTPDRSTLFYAQTPQVFRKELFLSCIERLGKRAENVTDDSRILELCGEQVKITEISGCNMKITRPEDLPAAQAIYSIRKNSGNLTEVIL